MEYRRRRRRRSKTVKSGGALSALAAVAMFAAAAYLILFAGAGKRIAEGVRDIGARIFPRTEAPLPTALFVETEAPGKTPAPSPAPAGETRSVTLPGIAVHMLRIGHFDSRQSADKAAEELKKKGAAGCVQEDNGVFSVIAAAYSDKADAESVMERLTAEGYECSIKSIVRDGCELMITANPERLLPVQSAFAIAPEIVVQLDELVRGIDSEAKSTEYGLGVLDEIKRNASAAVSGIGETEGADPWLGRIRAYLKEVERLIGEAESKSGQRADFSSLLKEIRLRTALMYAELIANAAPQ